MKLFFICISCLFFSTSDVPEKSFSNRGVLRGLCLHDAPTTTHTHFLPQHTYAFPYPLNTRATTTGGAKKLLHSAHASEYYNFSNIYSLAHEGLLRQQESSRSYRNLGAFPVVFFFFCFLIPTKQQGEFEHARSCQQATHVMRSKHRNFAFPTRSCAYAVTSEPPQRACALQRRFVRGILNEQARRVRKPQNNNESIVHKRQLGKVYATCSIPAR